MTSEERYRHTKPEYAELLKAWPVERIKALSEAEGMSITQLSAVLGITRRTLRFLMDGHYTPSATMCRRMEQIEQELQSGMSLETDIIPKRAEMRRRLLLFRSWWMNRDPTRDLPEITVSIKVRWGKGVINVVEIPPKLLPRLRIASFSGLVDTVRAMTKVMRGVAKGYSKLLWTVQEEDYWQAYSQNDLPAIVEQRAKIPGNAARGRKWRPVKDA